MPGFYGGLKTTPIETRGTDLGPLISAYSRAKPKQTYTKPKSESSTSESKDDTPDEFLRTGAHVQYYGNIEQKKNQLSNYLGKFSSDYL